MCCVCGGVLSPSIRSPSAMSDSDSDSGLVDHVRSVKVAAAGSVADGSRTSARSSGGGTVASPRSSAAAHASASASPSFTSSGVSDANADMSEALEQIGYGRFQQRILLPITGLTLMADAMVREQTSTAQQ